MTSPSEIDSLMEEIHRLTKERDYYASLVGAFVNGEKPRKGSILHFIMAKWGRKRLEEIGTIPALLRTESD